MEKPDCDRTIFRTEAGSVYSVTRDESDPRWWQLVRTVEGHTISLDVSMIDEMPPKLGTAVLYLTIKDNHEFEYFRTTPVVEVQ